MPLSDAEITKKVGQLRKTEGKIYAPLKYFRGLETLGQVETRYKKMLKRDYKDFKTDSGVRTRTSSYTQKFRKKIWTGGQVSPRDLEGHWDTSKDPQDGLQ